jgi:hypothetical protein
MRGPQAWAVIVSEWESRDLPLDFGVESIKSMLVIEIGKIRSHYHRGTAGELTCATNVVIGHDELTSIGKNDMGH